MSHGVLANGNLFAMLGQIDTDLAEQARRRGCEVCGGRSDVANFPRKPRGPMQFDGAYAKRLSFCCGRDGCRARVTPPSVRFLGRRVYVGAVVLIVSAKRHGATGRRVAELHRLFGVSVRTVERWRAWWTEWFPSMPFWRAARGLFLGDVDTATLPASLIEHFGDAADAQVVARVLVFLSPITTTSCATEARISMVD